jgi:hypothetical protein
MALSVLSAHGYWQSRPDGRVFENPYRLISRAAGLIIEYLAPFQQLPTVPELSKFTALPKGNASPDWAYRLDIHAPRNVLTRTSTKPPTRLADNGGIAFFRCAASLCR